MREVLDIDEAVEQAQRDGRAPHFYRFMDQFEHLIHIVPAVYRQATDQVIGCVHAQQVLNYVNQSSRMLLWANVTYAHDAGRDQRSHSLARLIGVSNIASRCTGPDASVIAPATVLFTIDTLPAVFDPTDDQRIWQEFTDAMRPIVAEEARGLPAIPESIVAKLEQYVPMAQEGLSLGLSCQHANEMRAGINFVSRNFLMHGLRPRDSAVPYDLTVRLANVVGRTEGVYACGP